MSRIDKLLNGNDECNHPHDINILKNTISELKSLPNKTVEDLYSQFSDIWAARWLIIDEDTIEQFADWLRR